MSDNRLIYIDGFSVRLDSVPINLQNDYNAAELAVKCAPPGPIRNKAKSRLNECAKAILVASMPHLLFKSSPKFRGASGFYEAVHPGRPATTTMTPATRTVGDLLLKRNG
jgi:hypothetical protein